LFTQEIIFVQGRFL